MTYHVKYYFLIIIIINYYYYYYFYPCQVTDSVIESPNCAEICFNKQNMSNQN